MKESEVWLRYMLKALHTRNCDDQKVEIGMRSESVSARSAQWYSYAFWTELDEIAHLPPSKLNTLDSFMKSKSSSPQLEVRSWPSSRRRHRRPQCALISFSINSLAERLPLLLRSGFDTPVANQSELHFAFLKRNDLTFWNVRSAAELGNSP